MNEQDKNCCDSARVALLLEPPSISKSVAEDLLAIIERLNERLTEKEELD